MANIKVKDRTYKTNCVNITITTEKGKVQLEFVDSTYDVIVALLTYFGKICKNSPLSTEDLVNKFLHPDEG